MLLDAINEDLSVVNIEWYYVDEDIDMKEMGEDFKDAMNVDFSFFEVIQMFFLLAPFGRMIEVDPLIL